MSFAYSNTTASGEKIPGVVLGMVTNYAKVVDEPDMARMSNKTATVEQPELVTYRSERINKVSTAIPVRNPAPISDGIQYTIKIETVDRSGTAPAIIDEPIAAWLTIKHPATNTWTNAKVAEVVSRLLSACLKGLSSTGTGDVTSTDWRFEDLMRSALVPTVD